MKRAEMSRLRWHAACARERPKTDPEWRARWEAEKERTAAAVGFPWSEGSRAKVPPSHVVVCLRGDTPVDVRFYDGANQAKAMASYRRTDDQHQGCRVIVAAIVEDSDHE